MRNLLLTISLFLSASAWAASPGQDTLLFGSPGWALPGASVDMNFTTGQYFGLTPGQLTVSRASTEYEICNGQLYGPFANNVLGVTPGCGAWVWEARTGLPMNSQMVGAAAGSPGTLPTNWSVTPIGLTQQIVGTGTLANGMPYIDIRLSGTTTGQFGSIVFPGTYSGIAYGQTYTISMYAALVASPNIANISNFDYKLFDGVSNNGSGSLPINSSLSPYVYSVTFISSGANSIIPGIVFSTSGASGQTADFTLRIALPQIELNPNLLASVASATVAGGGAAYVGASGTMTYSGAGCTTNPVLNVTTSAGAINAVTSVATAGVCPSGLPAAGATTWTPGGGLSVGTGASFNLVPTDNSAQAFATGPILTSVAAVTRAATNATGPLPSCSNPSVYVAGTPAAPTTYPVTQFAALVDDGGTTNLVKMIRAANTGQPVVGTKTQIVTVSGGPWTQSTPAKLTESIGGGNVNGRFGGGTVSTAAATSPPALNRLQIGSQNGASNFNGDISRLAYACNGNSLLNQ